MSKILELEVYPPFEGIPAEGMAFLRDLKENNNREWFNARKKDFEEYLKFPAQCLIAELGRRLSDDFPAITFHPQKSLFRIYRDTRFSKDKSPYKTNIGAHFTSANAIGTDVPGLYVHIEPGAAFAGGGLYMPDAKQLRALRESLVADGDTFLDVVGEERFKTTFGEIRGEKLQKPPKGYSAEQPLAEYLKLKQYFVIRSFEETSVLDASFAERAAETFRAAAPLLQWLNDKLA